MAPTSNRLLGNNGQPEALFCKSWGMQSSKNVTTMAGCTTTMSRPYFCFYLDGTIPIAFFNIPGLVHNSQVVEYGNIYGKLEDVFWLTGAKCCIDLAFGQVNREYLYKLSQDLLASSAPTHHERKLKLWKKGRQHRRCRQLSGECAWFRPCSHGSRIDLCTKRKESEGFASRWSYWSTICVQGWLG